MGVSSHYKYKSGVAPLKSREVDQGEENPTLMYLNINSTCATSTKTLQTLLFPLEIVSKSDSYPNVHCKRYKSQCKWICKALAIFSSLFWHCRKIQFNPILKYYPLQYKLIFSAIPTVNEMCSLYCRFPQIHLSFYWPGGKKAPFLLAHGLELFMTTETFLKVFKSCRCFQFL